MTERTCKTCAYYQPHWGKTRISTPGKCRIRPPVVVAEPRGWETVWPRVRSTDWCGKHKFKADWSTT